MALELGCLAMPNCTKVYYRLRHVQPITGVFLEFNDTFALVVYFNLASRSLICLLAHTISEHFCEA